MHELGIMFHVVETVLKIAEENGLSQVDTIVLEAGALSPVVPKYLHDCFPAAVDGTMLETTKLKVETIPALGRCGNCNATYDVIQNRKVCPGCGQTKYDLLSGTEFNIREIITYTDK